MTKADAKSLAKFPGPLLLLGAGKMGFAMLEGWLARGFAPGKLIVLEPQPAKAVTALTRRGLKLNPKAKAAAAAAIVIAVKPQTAPQALPALHGFVGKGTLVISIMAGRTLRFLENALPAGTSIVRAAIGAVEWTDDEGIMDAVTALSGSGPAYVFLLAEAMTKAGITAGLPAELAAKLARETVAGSGELLRRFGPDAATLRQIVASPGGRTAAALEILRGPGGFDELLTKAIAAATRRGRELAG